MLRISLILSMLMLVLPCGARTADGDARAYDLIREASSMIGQRRYTPAMAILDGIDSLEGVTDINLTQAAAARTRAAIGMGDYAGAMRLYHTARLYSPDVEADDMLRLIGSEICFATGDCHKALALADSVTTPRYATTRAAHRVRALTMLGMYTAAIESADSALAAAATGMADTRGVLLQNRGYARWENGDMEGAAADLREAAEAVTHPTDRLNLLGNLAMVESALGRHSEAIRHIREAAGGLDGGTPDGLAARRKLGVILRNAGRTREASQTLRDFFRRGKEALMANLPSMSAAERLNLWSREKELLSACFDARTDAAFMFEVAMFRRLTSLLGMRDPSALESLTATCGADVRRSLGVGETAMEIVAYSPARDRRGYAAILLPWRGKASFVHLMDEEELHLPGTVGTNSLYNALKRESPDEKNLLYSDSLLASRIWAPVLAAIPEGTTDIYFAPEGIFHLWGIENMPLPEGAPRLHRVTSTALLAGRRHAAEGNGGRTRTLVIGGLDYNRTGTDTIAGSGDSEASETLRSRGWGAMFSYLKGTRAEADSVGSIIKGADVRHSMGEAALKAIMPGYDIVHIATHGYSLGFGVKRRPEFMADSVAVDRSLSASGLALSGANAGYDPASGEDGLLSAREICGMDLSGVDFVVLSACRTAMGDVNDEGPAGLVRALKMAGVRSVIATLWEVDDMSTMLFMQAFHKAMAEGRPRHEAFRAAQRRVRCEPTMIPYRAFSPRTMARERTVSHRVIPPFSDPYHWAPFILIDDF